MEYNTNAPPKCVNCHQTIHPQETAEYSRDKWRHFPPCPNNGQRDIFRAEEMARRFGLSAKHVRNSLDMIWLPRP